LLRVHNISDVTDTGVAAEVVDTLGNAVILTSTFVNVWLKPHNNE